MAKTTYIRIRLDVNQKKQIKKYCKKNKTNISKKTIELWNMCINHQTKLTN